MPGLAPCITVFWDRQRPTGPLKGRGAWGSLAEGGNAPLGSWRCAAMGQDLECFLGDLPVNWPRNASWAALFLLRSCVPAVTGVWLLFQSHAHTSSCSPHGPAALGVRP